MDSPSAIPAPVADSQRIASIDVLRGLAVLGILVMNIQSFAMIGAAYSNPTAYGDLTGANYWIWYLCHVFADMKMMTIFSMLFGAGVLLMTQRAESLGRSSAALHYRRMGWLILFGLLHAHLLWYGDILYSYGMCGLLLWLFRNRRPATLLIIGLVLVVIGSLVTLFFALSFPYWPQAEIEGIANDWLPPPSYVQSELETYQGGWLDQMPHRTQSALFFQTFLFLIFFIWRMLGCMLIGMALYKWGVFSAQKSRAFDSGLIALALFVGVPIILYGIHYNESHQWDYRSSFFHGGQFNYWGSMFVALGWVGAVMLLCKSRAWDWLTGALAPVGRMALTCYLLETILCTTIFYGHGLGYFGKLDRVEMFGVVLAVWAFLILFAPLWLHHFRFGPFEWLWRTLTYWKPQPMRNANTP